MSNQPQGDLCSLYSQANGEDPIGSATPFDQCLIVEIPAPWPRDVWQVSASARRIKQTVAAGARAGTPVRLLALAPDPAYSQAGTARVFWYQRPQTAYGSPLFAAYDRQEYQVPHDRLPQLVEALVTDAGDSPETVGQVQSRGPARDLFVCTHDSRDACCGRFGLQLFRQLQAHAQATGDMTLRVWRISHLGGHRLAPTLMDMPSGQAFGHLTPDLLEPLLYRTGNLEQLLACYRGWSGLTKYAQIAEREIWRAQGWQWPAYRRTGHTVMPEADGTILIRIDYESPDCRDRGSYQARVAPKDQVHTLNNSYTDKYFYIDRYQVHDLEHREGASDMLPDAGQQS